MDVTVRKATSNDIAEMRTKSVWECGVSTFDWSYDSEERCLIIEGEVTVTYDGKSIHFAVGDYVVFPKGLSCVWDVTKSVKKHYMFV